MNYYNPGAGGTKNAYDPLKGTLNEFINGSRKVLFQPFEVTDCVILSLIMSGMETLI